jgi:hypothetical protein
MFGLMKTKWHLLEMPVTQLFLLWSGMNAGFEDIIAI